MQIAADAVFDAVAPPRPRAPRAEEGAPEAKSFDDHLDETACAEPPPSRADTIEGDSDPADAPKAAAADDKPAEAGAQASPPPREPPASPITLQILADATAAAITPDENAAPAEHSDTPTDEVSAPPQQAAVVAPIVSGKALPAKGKSADEAHAADDGKSQVRPIANTESGPAPVEPSSAVADDTASQSAQPEQREQNAGATDTSADQATPAPIPDAPAPPPQTIVAPKIATTQGKSEAPAAAAIEAADHSAGPAAPEPEQTLSPGRSRSEERAHADTEARGASDATKNDGPKTANLVAPKDSFTALLAQQDSAPPAQASHASGAATVGATQTTTATATQQAAIVAPPSAQVGREVVRRFNGGSTRFDLRLDPPELGRVEVKLEVSRDHRVTAIVAADNPQALAELTRHARDLEQALQSAGLELSDEGISFDLSQQRENNADRPEQTRTRAGATESASIDAPPVASRALTLDAWRGSRVDLVA